MATQKLSASSFMQISNKVKKIAIFSLLLLFGFLLFLSTLLYNILETRKLPPITAKEEDRAIRGAVVSADGFNLVLAQKLYKAIVNTKSIDPAKKDLFVKLFAIYSGMSEKEIKKSLKKNSGIVVLSYTIDPKSAKYLKELAKTLYRMGVFVEYEENGRLIKQGLDILESGESRNYPYQDLLTPMIGYIRKYEADGYTKVQGVKGIEKYYNDQLEAAQNGLIQGPRDVGSNIMLNKRTKIVHRVDGLDVHLNIPLKLQKSIEKMVDEKRQKLQADEIIVSVMESQTGKVLALASSNRFNPKQIRKSDYPALNINAIEYTFEPGSVLKPLIFSLLLEKQKVNPKEIVQTYNGRFKFGRKIITDEHKAAWMSAEDVIVNSSNIGIAQLAQRLSGIEFYQGLSDFGLSQKSGIDLPYEQSGLIPAISQLNSEIYKATVSYGYGLRVNFMQLLKAFNVFNADGLGIEPRIVGYLTDQNQKRYPVASNPPKQLISTQTASIMHDILVQTVERGTGIAARTPGLEIGGKTGTAHIASSGGYTREFHSSFFGFANDAKSRYTIGVVIVKPKNGYFAAITAVPVFKSAVEILIENGFLSPQAKAASSKP